MRLCSVFSEIYIFERLQEVLCLYRTQFSCVYTSHWDAKSLWRSQSSWISQCWRKQRVLTGSKAIIDNFWSLSSTNWDFNRSTSKQWQVSQWSWRMIVTKKNSNNSTIPLVRSLPCLRVKTTLRNFVLQYCCLCYLWIYDNEASLYGKNRGTSRSTRRFPCEGRFCSAAVKVVVLTHQDRHSLRIWRCTGGSLYILMKSLTLRSMLRPKSRNASADRAQQTIWKGTQFRKRCKHEEGLPVTPGSFNFKGRKHCWIL